MDTHRTTPPHKTTKTTNWALYRHIVNTTVPANIPIATQDELDIATLTYQNTIRQAYRDATITTKPNKLTDEIPDLIAILREKRRVRKRWQRHRQPIDKQYLNYITRHVHNMIDDHKTRTLDTDLKTAVGNNNLWKVTRNFTGNRRRRNHPLHGAGGLVYEAEEKAEAIALTLDRNFRSRTDDYTHEQFHSRTRRQVRQFLSTQPMYNIPLTTPSEIRRKLKTMHNDKAPGPDGIPVRALKELPRKGLTHLTKLFNSSLLLKHFPEPFKSAHIIAIHKPTKSPLFPQNYRPISLLDHAGKLLEKIILHRLQPHLTDVIPETQFGFRTDHSTTLQLLRLTDDITTGFLNRQHTTAVFFDVEKAFDSVWHMGLTRKLINTHIPDSYIHILHNYITHRQFRVTHEGKLSGWYPMKAGVPQGSVLAPTLYNIYTSDIPKSRNTKIAQYADDTAIYCTNTDIHYTTNALQTHIRKLETWFSKWRIKVNADKTDAIVFTRRRPRNITELTINDRLIDYKDKTKYLGITLDKALTFQKHIKITQAKASQRLRQIYPILKSHIPTLKHKVLIYTTLIRPMLLYASPAWGHAAAGHLKKLQVTQNRAARIIAGADFYTTTKQLHEDLELQYIQDIIKRDAKNLKTKYRQHTNRIINSIGSTQTQGTLQYRTPHDLIN